METQSDTTQQLVITKVADVLCGIEIDAVHEIIPTQKITAVPRSPRNMLGVTDVRGSVIPVVDLRACLRYQPAEFTSDTRIVLVSYGESKVGLVVDGVAEVITLEKDVFQPVTSDIGDAGYLKSVARMDDRLILHIDHARAIKDGLDVEPSEITSLLKDIAEDVAVEDTVEDSAEEESDEAAAIEEPVAETTTEDDVDTSADDTTTETEEDDSEEGGLNVELLESSFQLLAPRGEELVERFYERLFETAPAVRELFPEDLADQRKALLGALGAIVSSLRNPDKLTAYLEELGAKHVGFGAVEAHYDVVAQVLVEVMAEVAGDDVWNSDLQTAWSDALTAVKGIMLAGADAAATDVPESEAA